MLSVTILIGAEVFGAAFAASWAIATLFDLGGIGARMLDIALMLCGLAIMVQFVRSAHMIEPFTARAERLERDARRESSASQGGSQKN